MMIHICIGNHAKKDGIEDFIGIISRVVTRREHTLSVSHALVPGKVNLIIEEFTNYLFNRDFRDFRRDHPETPVVFVLTEFITTSKFIRTFNFFGGWLDASVIAAMNVYIRLERKDYFPPSAIDWITALAYLPLLPIFVLHHQVSNLRRKHPIGLRTRLHRNAYMLMRYMGLESSIGYADFLIGAHPAILGGLRRWKGKQEKYLGVIHPEFSEQEIELKFLKNKSLFFEITGSVTDFRMRFIRAINSEIVNLGLKSVFGLCKARSFNTSRDEANSGAFSLHPPQLKRWAYCSPTRLYRAIEVDGNIPVVITYYGQHAIEDLAYRLEIGKIDEMLASAYRMYRNPEAAWAEMREKIQRYNAIAVAENDRIFNNLQM